jgi:hypothetical protein
MIASKTIINNPKNAEESRRLGLDDDVTYLRDDFLETGSDILAIPKLVYPADQGDHPHRLIGQALVDDYIENSRRIKEKRMEGDLPDMAKEFLVVMSRYARRNSSTDEESNDRNQAEVSSKHPIVPRSRLTDILGKTKAVYNHDISVRRDKFKNPENVSNKKIEKEMLDVANELLKSRSRRSVNESSKIYNTTDSVLDDTISIDLTPRKLSVNPYRNLDLKAKSIHNKNRPLNYSNRFNLNKNAQESNTESNNIDVKINETKISADEKSRPITSVSSGRDVMRQSEAKYYCFLYYCRKNHFETF